MYRLSATQKTLLREAAQSGIAYMDSTSPGWALESAPNPIDLETFAMGHNDCCALAQHHRVGFDAAVDKQGLSISGAISFGFLVPDLPQPIEASCGHEYRAVAYAVLDDVWTAAIVKRRRQAQALEEAAPTERVLLAA